VEVIYLILIRYFIETIDNKRRFVKRKGWILEAIGAKMEPDAIWGVGRQREM